MSKEEKTNDCGAWTLKINNAGTALVGAYIWQEINDEIGHDFYQWTERELGELLRTSASLIDGAGVYSTHALPKGALVGELSGTPQDKPTREPIEVGGKHIHPSHDS